MRLLGEMRDSKFGIFWNFASPAIQIITFYLVFGLAMGRGDMEGIPYLPWVVVGFCAWWYIQPCIVHGCSAIFSKVNVITKMKFPISVLPMTVVLKELFNHFCMLGDCTCCFAFIRLFSQASLVGYSLLYDCGDCFGGGDCVDYLCIDDALA